MLSSVVRGLLTPVYTLRRGVTISTLLLVGIAPVPTTVGSPVGALGQEEETEEPDLRLRASPRVGFAPAEVLFVGTLRGGSDHHEPFYCASVEWEWDDGTHSERIPDCDPFEPGTSEIRRRFSQRHTFQHSGRYEVRLSLKRRDDVVASVQTVVEIRGGFP